MSRPCGGQKAVGQMVNRLYRQLAVRGFALFYLARLTLLAASSAALPSLRFEVSRAPGLTAAPEDGRLFVILGRTNQPEPRLALGRPGLDAPPALARDVNGFAAGRTVVVDQSAYSFPMTNLVALPAGDYFVQALLDVAADLRAPDAPGDLYSDVQQVHLDPARGRTVALELTQQVPAEQAPPDTDQVKFVRLQSKLLSRFYGRPIFLRAGIVLPRDFAQEPSRRYPLWVRIGGFNTRYTSVTRLMAEKSEFKQVWVAADTPRLVILQLDGAGPHGDPYQVNSANNGPYGDAVVQELIPYVETSFRAVGEPRARVLSGVSTGGWVALALQIFYPDTFNGAWSSCPDPVDFRAFQLVNIYTDDNAYMNRYGNERPSERDLHGDVALTMRREVGAENLLGRGNSYAMSGGQWGAWNAVFSPRGRDGLPVPLWDPQTGKIERSVAKQWQKYDLRLVLEQNWKTLAPRLRGKLHISAGEADQYFLNNAVHLLEGFLVQADPQFAGTIVYGPGKAHGWTNLSLGEMLSEMQAATERAAR